MWELFKNIFESLLVPQNHVMLLINVMKIGMCIHFMQLLWSQIYIHINKIDNKTLSSTISRQSTHNALAKHVH